MQDGGSSDETLDVLEALDLSDALGRPRPTAVRPTRSTAASESTTGDIMAWLNSDDLLLPGSLPYVARYFVEHPEVDVVYGHRLLIDENDRRIGAWILPRHDDRRTHARGLHPAGDPLLAAADLGCSRRACRPELSRTRSTGICYSAFVTSARRWCGFLAI